MTETILPGVYIDVRPEGLIVPGAVSVGNLGVVGTASKGPIGTPVVVGSYADAVARFGTYDRWVDGDSGELTLVRALEQAYRHGATTVHAVRIAEEDGAGAATAAGADLASAGGSCVRVAAATPGTWGHELSVKVTGADDHALVRDEEVDASTLAHTPVVPSAQNRIRIRPGGGGTDVVPAIVYDTDPEPSQVAVATDSGALTFGTPPGGTDEVLATYLVAKTAAVKVTIASDTASESYNVVSGDDLIHDLEDSELVRGEALDHPDELPAETEARPLTGGTNGAAGALYPDGLAALLGVDAHIIVAAGQDQSFGNTLAAHCEAASGDEVKRERIAVVGSALDAGVDDLQGHPLNSPRVIFVAPGIQATDAARTPPETVTLSGAYAAAAVAGRLSSLSAHVSPTNKVLPVDGLEQAFTTAEVRQLILSRVLVLEARQGFRIVKGITTSTNTAWHQITTRRIVDYAKLGVRSAASSYIGLLNNTRVRGALRATINSFLSTMVDDEMLISYELDVSATRDEERRGIARVTMVVRPTFSIDFIRVTMFLE